MIRVSCNILGLSKMLAHTMPPPQIEPGTLYCLRLDPSCQQNLNQASKTDFKKKWNCSKMMKWTEIRIFPKNQTMSKPLQLKNWCWESPSAFLWTRNQPGQPQWTKLLLAWGQNELKKCVSVSFCFPPSAVGSRLCKWAQMGEKWFR